MKFNSLAVFITFFAFHPSIATSEGRSPDAQKITGSYYFTGKTVVDPPVGEVKDRIALVLDGDVARQMYVRMKVKEVVDVCQEGTASRKQAGNLSCIREGRKYTCFVAIHLQRGSSESAVAC